MNKSPRTTLNPKNPKSPKSSKNPKNSQNSPNSIKQDASINKIFKITDKIAILGSIHISKESMEQVTQGIRKLNPEWVLMELDKERFQRYNHLPNKGNKHTFPKSDPISEPNPETGTAPEDPEVPDAPSLKLPFMQVLEGLQQDMGNLSGVFPGSEMVTAIDLVQRLQIPFKLIDRPISETMHRLATVTLQGQEEQDHLLSQIDHEEMPTDAQSMESLFQDFKNPEVLTEILHEFRQTFPMLAKIFLDERDAYMLTQIRSHIQEYPQARILIIVGGGHMHALIQGIRKITSSQHPKLYEAGEE